MGIQVRGRGEATAGEAQIPSNSFRAPQRSASGELYPLLTSSDHTPPSSWYALGVLILTGIFAFLDRQILSLVMPSLQKSLRLSDLQLGAMQGLGLAIFAGVAGYPMGWLADRYGRRLLLVVGVVVWTASTAACAFQTSFHGLFLSTIGIAIGEAGLIPVIFGMLPDLFGPRERNLANFIFFAAGTLGGALGVSLGGLTLRWISTHHGSYSGILAAFEPWRLTMIAVALPAPVFVALIATLPIRRRNPHLRRLESNSSGDGFVAFVKRNGRAFACIFGAIFGYFLPMAALYSWLPLALFRMFGFPPAEAGMRMGGIMFVAGLAGLVLPTTASKLWPGEAQLKLIHIARLFAFLAILPTIYLYFATSPAQVFVAAAVQLGLCLATGACMPGIVQDMSPPLLRSRILSLVAITSAIAQAVSPLAIGAMSSATTAPAGVLIAITVVGGLGFLLASVLLTLAIPSFSRAVRAVQQ